MTRETTYDLRKMLVREHQRFVKNRESCERSLEAQQLGRTNAQMFIDTQRGIKYCDDAMAQISKLIKSL